MRSKVGMLLVLCMALPTHYYSPSKASDTLSPKFLLWIPRELVFPWISSVQRIEIVSETKRFVLHPATLLYLADYTILLDISAIYGIMYIKVLHCGASRQPTRTKLRIERESKCAGRCTDMVLFKAFKESSKLAYNILGIH